MSNQHLVEQTQIIVFIRNWHAQYRPSFRDVAKGCGLPLGTTYRLCKLLKEQGRITFTEGVARSLDANI